MYHTIIIVGNLGKDPEMRYTPSGQAVTSFSVASNRKYTSSNGEQVNETIWFRISAWGKQAEICNQYLKKGSKVLVEGRLTPDKNTGGPRIWQKQDGSFRRFVRGHCRHGPLPEHPRRRRRWRRHVQRSRRYGYRSRRRRYPVLASHRLNRISGSLTR